MDYRGCRIRIKVCRKQWGYSNHNIKTKLDPIPVIDLQFEKVDGKKIFLLHVKAGQETPYYYIGDKQRSAFMRVGNETAVTDRVQLKNLVMKGSNLTFDSLPSSYRFDDMAFSKLKSVHYKRLQRSFEDSEFTSWGIVDEKGNLTNTGVLLADESPIRQSRIFCTHWNGLTMTSGLSEAIDDVELEGCVIGQLQDAVSFVKNNSRKKWWKEDDFREEFLIIRSVLLQKQLQTLLSIKIIRKWEVRYMLTCMMIVWKSIRQAECWMAGLFRSLIQLTIPSKRRNPLLTDF